jgi:hypothetical protein
LAFCLFPQPLAKTSKAAIAGNSSLFNLVEIKGFLLVETLME